MISILHSVNTDYSQIRNKIYMLLLSLTSRKGQQHSILLKAVYSGTFQHACRKKTLSSLLSAPNRNPLYNPSTTPHQPSPLNSSLLSRIIIRHMVRSCIMIHLCSSTSGRCLIRVYEEVRCKSWDLAAVLGTILGLLPDTQSSQLALSSQQLVCGGVNLRGG